MSTEYEYDPEYENPETPEDQQGEEQLHDEMGYEPWQLYWGKY